MQIKDAEHRLRHKLFPPNAWMKLTDFNVLTSCGRTNCISDSWDCTGSTSFPPWFTVTPRCCYDQISFGTVRCVP